MVRVGHAVTPLSPDLLDGLAAPTVRGTHAGGEIWAAIGELLLGFDQLAEKLILAMAIPVHAAIFGRALADRLRSLPTDLRGARHEQDVNMARFLCSTCRDAALEQLEAARAEAASAERRGKIAAIADALHTSTRLMRSRLDRLFWTKSLTGDRGVASPAPSSDKICHQY